MGSAKDLQAIIDGYAEPSSPNRAFARDLLVALRAVNNGPPRGPMTAMRAGDLIVKLREFIFHYEAWKVLHGGNLYAQRCVRRWEACARHEGERRGRMWFPDIV